VTAENENSLTPPEETQAKVPTVLSLKELGKTPRDWALTLHPSHLALAESPGAQPYVIFREQMMKSATLIEGIRTLALKEPIKANFKLTPEVTTALAEWIGKPVLAAYYLKRRNGWLLPVALLWVIGSLPLKGDPARGISSIAFDPIGLGLGLMLVATWTWATWRPHPVLFLVDSLWFIALACQLVRNVVNGRSKGWLVLVVMALWAVVTGLKHFTRFRGTSIASLRR